MPSESKYVCDHCQQAIEGEYAASGTLYDASTAVRSFYLHLHSKTPMADQFKDGTCISRYIPNNVSSARDDGLRLLLRPDRVQIREPEESAPVEVGKERKVA